MKNQRLDFAEPNDLAAVSCRGATGLYFIPRNTTTNGHKYVELLEEKPKPLFLNLVCFDIYIYIWMDGWMDGWMDIM